MPLYSQLLSGDPKLEAAAIADPAHITRGASGEHVRKLQLALIQLDGAAIDPDGIYGPATAAAVLRFKQKRGIVNRAYQTSADDIVGRMTIAAMDAELVQAEAETRKRPRIVGVWPQARANYRPRRPEDIIPVLATSARGAKSFADNPQIIVPGHPFQTIMEIKLGGSGGFRVVDGKGGIVKCLDSSVGVVSDPQEPLAHSGAVRISASPKSFRVLGQGAGETFIEARRPGQAFPTGDLIKLVVLAHSDKLTWRPTWTVATEDRMRCEPWGSRAFGPADVPGMLLKSPLFKFTGGVDPDATVSRGDFEVGILQTCLKTELNASYVNASNVPTWTLTIACAKTPMRDTADRSPLWYDSLSVKPLNGQGRTKVDANDAPQSVLPWQTEDKKGTLVSTEGVDIYCTWLAVRQKATGTLTFLCYAAWSVNWGCIFDFKTQGRTVTGTGVLNGQGTDGQGPLQAVTTGKAVIEEVTMVWTGPGF